ncbi:MAG TPA: tyrosine--tRNA ligase [Candidatus Saccharimonadales bacterium]|nr:tyrosine--tRNA ligase [Candidatus Saccharimonadales bacterium]
MRFPEVDEQLKIIGSGIEELIPREEFGERLERAVRHGRPLRIKQGFDPTAPDIHLGHTVGLRKLRQFQDLGHQVVLIVGDYTGRVGDPSGRSATRPQLTGEELELNARTYLQQFFKVLAEKPEPPKLPVQIHRNGEWFAPMGMEDVIRLCGRYTVARMLERDDFAKRLEARHPISVHELLYPLMQGFDSVMIRCDLELGATEQKFNLLVGRSLQEDYARGEMAWCGRFLPEDVRSVPVPQQGQVVLTVPILVGTDGVQRMSKSLGNYIGVDEPANIMYEKVRHVPNELLRHYAELLLDLGSEDRKSVMTSCDAAQDPQNPAANASYRAASEKLAVALVTAYHGREEAEAAREQYRKRGAGKPPEVRIVELPATAEPTTWIGYLAVKAGLAKSTSEARTLLRDGGISRMTGAWAASPENTVWLKAGADDQVPSAAGAPPLLLRKGKRQETSVEIRWK